MRDLHAVTPHPSIHIRTRSNVLQRGTDMTMEKDNLQRKVTELEAELKKPEIFSDTQKYSRLSRDYKETHEILEGVLALEKLDTDITALRKDLAGETNDELRSMMDEELASLEQNRTKLATEVHDMLHPADPNDSRNVIMEIRAGTGGDESALFAAELFRMYSRFAERRGWKCHMISSNRTGLGGFKEIIFSIEGEKAYRMLKYEMGVHRVQRVPETEKSGRVHTSAATVAVLPEAEEVDIDIKPSDIRIDVFMAGGHGGQSVNTTYSAVRITHLPTGMVVGCQDERSQQQNKLKAMTILRSRLLAMEIEKRQQERADARKSQVGTGDRSEKIRTYNFTQDRLTDHRIKQNFHNLAVIMDGELSEIIEALNVAARKAE